MEMTVKPWEMEKRQKLYVNSKNRSDIRKSLHPPPPPLFVELFVLQVFVVWCEAFWGTERKREAFHAAMKRSQTPILIRWLGQLGRSKAAGRAGLSTVGLLKGCTYRVCAGDREASVPHIKTAGVTDRVPLVQASMVCTVHKSWHCVKGHVLD